MRRRQEIEYRQEGPLDCGFSLITTLCSFVVCSDVVEGGYHKE